ncbi:hypothetical protein [Levilactobacillus tongjiangensis]|uniref:Uncharacterized protein n=1 Tax=Levilactobacillus tongjiangensis TaxID=2486023 RepID=A0ABW1SR96_9LACO
MVHSAEGQSSPHRLSILTTNVAVGGQGRGTSRDDGVTWRALSQVTAWDELGASAIFRGFKSRRKTALWLSPVPTAAPVPDRQRRQLKKKQPLVKMNAIHAISR